MANWKSQNWRSERNGQGHYWKSWKNCGFCQKKNSQNVLKIYMLDKVKNWIFQKVHFSLKLKFEKCSKFDMNLSKNLKFYRLSRTFLKDLWNFLQTQNFLQISKYRIFNLRIILIFARNFENFNNFREIVQFRIFFCWHFLKKLKITCKFSKI